MKMLTSRKLMVAVVTLFAALAMTASVSQAGQWVDGKLQPLKDGFPKRPLTVMVVDEPGSTDSLYTMVLVEVAKKMSPVPIKIQHRQDFSNFGTWEAISWIMDQRSLEMTVIFPLSSPHPVVLSTCWSST